MKSPGFIRYIIDYVFPRQCHVCGSDLAIGSGERYICTSCIADLPRSLFHRNPDNPMAMRFAGIFPFERASSLLIYNHDSSLAQLIQDFKYRGFPGLARHLGSLMGQELLMTGFLSDIDYIIPIPMHFIKKTRRGYNQVELLADGLSISTGIPVKKHLRAIKSHKSQTLFSLTDRLTNMKDVFKAVDVSQIEHKHVLIIDDVCTTGATITSAVEALLSASPNTRISILTLASTF